MTTAALLRELDDNDEITVPGWLPAQTTPPTRPRSNRALSLSDAISRLPRDEQRLLGLVYVNALSLREAAHVMGIPEAIACLVHARATRTIRAELAL